jgi:hypothetical protein
MDEIKKAAKVRIVSGSGFQVPGSKFQVPGSGFQVPGSKFRVPSSGFQVPDFCLKHRFITGYYV